MKNLLKLYISVMCILYALLWVCMGLLVDQGFSPNVMPLVVLSLVLFIAVYLTYNAND